MYMLVRYLELCSITNKGDLDYSVNGEKDSETGIGKIKRLPKQGIFHCQILLE